MDDKSFAEQMHERSAANHETIVAGNVAALYDWAKERVAKAVDSGEFKTTLVDRRFEQDDVRCRLRARLEALGLDVEYHYSGTACGVSLTVRW